MALRVCLLALAALTVEGFAPQSRGAMRRTSVAVDNSVETMLGADVETAGVWDPFGFAADCSEEVLIRRRATEIKHGRVAQLATVGMVMGDLVTLPGYLSKSANLKFADVPAGMAALKVVPLAGWVQIFLFCGAMELKFFKQEDGRAPGDIAPNGWVRYSDPAVKETKLLSELKNGRLAMMGIMGMMVQEELLGESTLTMLKSQEHPFGVNPFPDLSATL